MTQLYRYTRKLVIFCSFVAIPGHIVFTVIVSGQTESNYDRPKLLFLFAVSVCTTCVYLFGIVEATLGYHSLRIWVYFSLLLLETMAALSAALHHHLVQHFTTTSTTKLETSSDAHNWSHMRDQPWLYWTMAVWSVVTTAATAVFAFEQTRLTRKDWATALALAEVKRRKKIHKRHIHRIVKSYRPLIRVDVMQ